MQFIDFCHQVTLLNNTIENQGETGQWKFDVRKHEPYDSPDKTTFFGSIEMEHNWVVSHNRIPRTVKKMCFFLLGIHHLPDSWDLGYHYHFGTLT